MLQVPPELRWYKSGVFSSPACQDWELAGDRERYWSDPATAPLQLAVLLVGLGEDSQTGAKYWLARASWGENWGEAGHIRIRRGDNTAHCGLGAYMSVAVCRECLQVQFCY